MNTVGTGLFASISVLYFTQVVGFGVAQVAAVMTGAGLAGLAAAVPLGHLADRFGPRRMQVTLLLIMGLAAVNHVFVSQLWQYAIVRRLGAAAGPLVMAGLPLGLGAPGWLLLGLVLAAAGWAAGVTAR
ncbi:MFS transporter [Kineosporia babensis]|uniref:Major facilitator superfamily (MFS) profile domain-containing protein n=1 Tax=Kineosporia babensis TaxID=499548 RepID=A0A9X1NK77_9ACTN|nr:MFS transporter [Kineosporia babensis]MCD5316487.1 hypothetical protein [Kineosporia babensis]